jgi:SAM-dependent MidA family methyltransferase
VQNTLWPQEAHVVTTMSIELQPLSPDEQLHEAKLVALIQARIARAGGWIPFSQFMALALYAPGLGYYAAGAHKLGRGGDFVTAPELSPLFGACLATQCAEVLAACSLGEIMEVGAGSGVLARDILQALAGQGCLPARYRILETSPDLRARQQALLLPQARTLGVSIEWLDRIPEDPFSGVMIANEVLDALPVDRFRLGRSGLEAMGVTIGDAGLAWSAVPADESLRAAVAALALDSDVSMTSEYCPGLSAWLSAIAAPLSFGALLFIDYGGARHEVYHPSRIDGTLSCFHRHLQHTDPFTRIGLQDLTAWVDFTRVAEAAIETGLDMGGFTTQAHFLVANDFESHVAALHQSAPSNDVVDPVRAARRLVLPTDMGERFKCLALTRGDWPMLRGFRLRDFTHTL